MIWKKGGEEVKLVTGTEPGAGPVGSIHGPRSIRTRTPDGYANLYATSPVLLAAALGELQELRIFGFQVAGANDPPQKAEHPERHLPEHNEDSPEDRQESSGERDE